MNTHRYLYSSLLFWLTLSSLLFFSTIAAVRRTRTMSGCTTAERDALLAYKIGISDPSNRLLSWSINQDCCRWPGIVCHNKTTDAQVHVVQLNLQNPYAKYELALQNAIYGSEAYDHYDLAFRHASFGGKILSSSLLSLTHLEGLNLSWNNFGGVPIPELVGSLHKLRYLDLRMSNFGGKIPHQLGNLSKLRYLDLASEPNTGHFLVRLDWLSEWNSSSYVDSLDWLSGLSYLAYLKMSYVNLNAVSQHWLSVMSTLPSLQELTLVGCNLNHLSSSLSYANLSLNSLILSHNYFNSTLPNWLWNLTTLSTLDMSRSQIYGTIPVGIRNLASLMYLGLDWNSFHGPIPAQLWSLAHLEMLGLGFSFFGGHIPNAIGNLSYLSIISLQDCSFSGPIPAEIGNLTRLTRLYLDYNLLSSPIPLEIGKLSNLEDIDLAFNYMEGVLSQLHFSNSTSLKWLSLEGNYLDIAIDQAWVPPFQLEGIVLDSCKLGPSFPRWIHSQQTMEYLTISNGSIEDTLPDWFWNFSSSTLYEVDLSQNKITGVLPSSLKSMVRLKSLDLHGNLFQGSVPQLPPNMDEVNLSHNRLSGPLVALNFPYFLDLSNNNIVGSIPPSICLWKKLETVILSNNQISGQIPQCNWQETKNLWFLHLGNNKLTGKIPSSLGSLTSILSLRLNNNNLHGHFPSSLQNCSGLSILDLSDNKFFGQIPTWIGQKWQNLTILQLRSNMFYGNIPPQLGQLSNLQIIDLANNHLVGPIPYSLGDLNAIISISTIMTFPYALQDVGQVDGFTLDIKGNEFNISRILYLFKIIDLSNNRLSGEIPQELGFLAGLQTLNLSRNYFTGKIPNTIGGLKSLESLDLSFNNLSGAIPQGLTMLSSLSHLNLSYNNLSGTIPLGNQLQTLDDGSIYIGNPYLCGALINKSCFAIHSKDVMDEASNVMSNNLPITLGCLAGVWSVFVIILFKKDFRYLYFGMIDKIYDKAYVVVKVGMKRK